MLRFIDLSSSHTLTVSKRHHISPKGLDPGLHLRSTRAKWKCTCIYRTEINGALYNGYVYVYTEQEYIVGHGLVLFMLNFGNRVRCETTIVNESTWALQSRHH